MKLGTIRVTLKDPDGFYEGVATSIRESVEEIPGLRREEREMIIQDRMDDIWDILSPWVKHCEYITIEFNIDEGTATVVENE